MSLVELARYPDAALAHIVKGRLEAAGIPAHCFDTGMNFAEGAPLLFQVRVMVLAEDLVAARDVIAQDDELLVASENGLPDESFDEGGPSPARDRKRRMARWIVGYVVFFFGLAVVVDLLLPANPPPIEAEAYD